MFCTGNSDMKTVHNFSLSIWGSLKDVSVGSGSAHWPFGQKKTKQKKPHNAMNPLDMRESK